jgi:hypothetical protein
MESEVPIDHLVRGGLLVPSANRYPVNGTHKSRPVRTVFTVYEYRDFGIIGNNIQKLFNFVYFNILGLKSNMLMSDISITYLIAVRMDRAEIDNRLDSHLLKLLNTFRHRLSSAIQILSNLVKIRQLFILDRLCPVDRPLLCRHSFICLFHKQV